jgi:uncharacterized protein YjiS (DUF1127 family)
LSQNLLSDKDPLKYSMQYSNGEDNYRLRNLFRTVSGWRRCRQYLGKLPEYGRQFPQAERRSLSTIWRIVPVSRVWPLQSC